MWVCMVIRSLLCAVLFASCMPTVGETGDDTGGSGAACTTDMQCSGGTPLCAASGSCVQCETSVDCAGSTPVCGSNTCAAACASADHAAEIRSVPSDIIVVVDQSGSMYEETAHVQSKINELSSLLGASNVDYRVVMIASPNTGTTSICVPPPLGGASCGNNTRFRLVDQYVDSNNGPQMAISSYSQYSDFLRPEAFKHFLFITDDNSTLQAAQFLSQLRALQPAATFEDIKVHGIYAYGTPGGQGCTGTFGSGASEGTVYTDLISQTGGAAGVICTGNWTNVFMDITTSVISGSVACELPLPAPPSGKAIDLSMVSVQVQLGGMGIESLAQVQSASQCGPAGGWYYDNVTAPTRIVLCGQTCSELSKDPTADVKLDVGCQTPLL